MAAFQYPSRRFSTTPGGAIDSYPGEVCSFLRIGVQRACIALDHVYRGSVSELVCIHGDV